MSYRDGKTVTLAAGTPNTQNFKLKRACQVRVRTVDEQGKPVGGVRLMANNLAARSHIAPEPVSTNAEGWVTLGGLAPSKTEYIIATMHEGYAYEKLIIALDDPEQTPEQEITLRRGKTIKGTAICSDGKPPASWRILAEPSWWHFGRHSHGPTIGNDGSFILTNIVPGKYDVTISVPAGDNGSSPRPVLQQANLFDTEGLLNVKMDHPSPFSLVYITGHVKFVGQPKDRSFWIFADSKEPRYHSGFYLRDGNTEFKIGPVPKGTYELEVQNPGLDAKPVTVTAPAEEVEIIVSAKGQPKLNGRVIDAETKSPISRYRLRVYKLRTLSGPSFAQDPRWREIKNDGGNFEYEVHGPGVYKVQVAVPGFAWQLSDEINTVEDGGLPILIALSEGVSLSGTVVDEAGNPIDGATVIPLSKAADIYSAISNRSTDEEGAVETVNGKFELTNLVPGEESVKVVHPDYCLEVLHHVVVGPKRGDEPLRVTLNRGGTVRGRVFDTDGNPEPNVTLHFHDKHGPRSGRGEGALATVVTDANGFYEVQHLPDELCLVYRSERSNPSGVVRNAILPANGQIRTLDLGGANRLTGRLLLNGTPLNDADLILSDDSPHSGIFRAFAQTQSDGSFTFRGVPPGERTLYYSIPGRRGEWGQARTIEVTRQNVDLGRIDHVTGRLEVRVEPITVAEDEQLKVHLQSYDPIWAWGYAIGVNSRNRENRSFTIEQIPPGKYELTCFRLNYLKFRKIVEITPDNLRQSLTVRIPTGSAVLSGRIDKEIGRADHYTALKLWSRDGRISGVLIPDQDDGSYRMEHIPAGEYLIRKADTRDGHVIQKVNLQEGEQKTLDFTPDTIIPDPVTSGFLMVHSFSSEGIPLPCSPLLEGPEGILMPQSSQRANYGFIGKPGTYTLVIEYLGFETLRRGVELKPVSNDGTPADGYLINVFLNESN